MSLNSTDVTIDKSLIGYNKWTNWLLCKEMFDLNGKVGWTLTEFRLLYYLLENWRGRQRTRKQFSAHLCHARSLLEVDNLTSP